jgi:hypothetical protein
LLRLFVIVLCAARCSCFWRCSFSCTRKHQNVLLLTHSKYSGHSSRSWFRASSFIKLNKTQRDAQLF